VFEKEGYEASYATVMPQLAVGGGAGMAGNVVFGGLIGVAVDSSSGAMKDLTPNPVRVILRKAE
jgi:hypothetical protein